MEIFHSEGAALLVRAILALRTEEECRAFLEDLMTGKEIQDCSQRILVARMLREQKTYLEIAEKTGASTATISRVNRSLNYGHDGYDLVLRRLRGESETG